MRLTESHSYSEALIQVDFPGFHTVNVQCVSKVQKCTDAYYIAAAFGNDPSQERLKGMKRTTSNKKLFIFYQPISQYSKVIYFFTQCQIYHENESKTGPNIRKKKKIKQ